MTARSIGIWMSQQSRLVFELGVFALTALGSRRRQASYLLVCCQGKARFVIHMEESVSVSANVVDCIP